MNYFSVIILYLLFHSINNFTSGEILQWQDMFMTNRPSPLTPKHTHAYFIKDFPGQNWTDRLRERQTYLPRDIQNIIILISYIEILNYL